MAQKNTKPEPEGGFERRSKAIKEVYNQISDYARHGRPCILFGPTGAGKEFVARYYYQEYCKHRKTKNKIPFLSLNCGGITASLAMSELFGILPDVATQVREKPGMFEVANGGIFFLDEIADLPDEVKPALLRAVDPGTYEARRVGSNEWYSTENVIVICATDQPKSALRTALLNRLGHQVFVPGVDQRLDDIPPATGFFIREALQKRKDLGDVIVGIFKQDNLETGNERFENRLTILTESISKELLPLIRNRSWPGNFREMRIAIDTAVIRANDYNNIGSFCYSAVKYYDEYLKTVEIIEVFSSRAGTRNIKSPAENLIQDVDFDKELLVRIKNALPRKKEEEQITWAKFLGQKGDRTFFRRDLDKWFGYEKRSLQNRLKTLTKAGIISKVGRDQYRPGQQAAADQQSETALRMDLLKAFKEITFTPVERMDEVKKALELLNKVNSLFVSGAAKSGKTTFLFLLARQLIQSGHLVEYFSLKENTLSEILREIGLKLNIIREPDHEYEASLQAASIGKCLNEQPGNGRRHYLILDDTNLLPPTDQKVLIAMLQTWTGIGFILTGRKMGNDIRDAQGQQPAEIKVRPYKRNNEKNPE